MLHSGFIKSAFRPKLLNVSIINGDKEKPVDYLSSEDVTPHNDERQIGLDTNRSFVLYPMGGKTFSRTFQDYFTTFF